MILLYMSDDKTVIKVEAELPTEPYSGETLKKLYMESIGQKGKDNFIPLLTYFNKYFYKATDGKGYYYYIVDEEIYAEKNIVNDTSRFEKLQSKDLDMLVYSLLQDPRIDDSSKYCKSVKNLFKSETRTYAFSNDVFQPRHYSIRGKYYLNQCKGFKHKKYLPYDEYDEVTKSNVNKFLEFIKLVFCSNRDDSFDALLKYFSQLSHAKKSRTIMIAKTMEQGVGKSTLTDFIINHVFGPEICLISSTQPLLTDRNKILIGKLFVVFEELTTFSTEQWNGVSSKLKTMTTEDMTTFRGLYENEIQLRQTLNFWINSNVDAIKDSAGRRNIVFDINVAAWKDKDEKNAYFKDLRDNCFNDKVGEAFFSYLRTKIDSKDFDAQVHFPDTENKLNAIASQLPFPYRFIKEEYVLRKDDMEKIKPDALYNQFTKYCGNKNRTAIMNKNDFIQKLNVIGISRKDVKNSPYYKETAKDLYDIAIKEKWISPTELEELNAIENTNEKDDDGDDDEVEKDNLIKKLTDENESLKRTIEALEERLKKVESDKNNQTIIPTQIDEPVVEEKKKKSKKKKDMSEEVKEVEVIQPEPESEPIVEKKIDVVEKPTEDTQVIDEKTKIQNKINKLLIKVEEIADPDDKRYIFDKISHYQQKIKDMEKTTTIAVVKPIKKMKVTEEVKPKIKKEKKGAVIPEDTTKYEMPDEYELDENLLL